MGEEVLCVHSALVPNCSAARRLGAKTWSSYEDQIYRDSFSPASGILLTSLCDRYRWRKFGEALPNLLLYKPLFWYALVVWHNQTVSITPAGRPISGVPGPAQLAQLCSC